MVEIQKTRQLAGDCENYDNKPWTVKIASPTSVKFERLKILHLCSQTTTSADYYSVLFITPVSSLLVYLPLRFIEQSVTRGEKQLSVKLTLLFNAKQ